MISPHASIELIYFLIGFFLGILFTACIFVFVFYINDKRSSRGINEIGVFDRRDVSKEFLRTIDSIEENIKRKK